jgi:hypothetical protein
MGANFAIPRNRVVDTSDRRKEERGEKKEKQKKAR